MAYEPVAIYVAEANAMPQKDLLAKYRHEAGEHRRILFERGSGMCSTWRNFRQFLVDIGPSPGPDYLATRLVAGDLTYGPGKVAWMHRDRQPIPVDTAATLEPRNLNAMGQWTTIRGKPVEYTAIAKHLKVPFEVMSVALRANKTPDELVQQASIAETLAQCEAPWLPPEPERRDAFFGAYRMWHMQVQPRYAAAATPAFLYLYIALPGMVKSRNGLIELDLWSPMTEKGKRERSEHALWRRYIEAMMRVESVRAEFEIYKQYSLTSEIDELWDRVRSTEERFRTGPPVRPGSVSGQAA